MKRRLKSLAWHGNDKLIIVPDSGVLMLLAAPIPADFFIQDPQKAGWLPEERRPKHFYDILLNFLPREKIHLSALSKPKKAKCSPCRKAVWPATLPH